MSKLPEAFTTVTPFTKALALSMLIVFPILGFLLGVKYQESKKVQEYTTNTVRSRSFYDQGGSKYKEFSLTYPELCTANSSRISCSNKDVGVDFDLYFHSKPLEIENKKSQITLGNYTWDKMDAGNLVAYEIEENDGIYLFNVRYGNYSKTSEKIAEQILSTFKFIN